MKWLIETSDDIQYEVVYLLGPFGTRTEETAEACIAIVKLAELDCRPIEVYPSQIHRLQ